MKIFERYKDIIDDWPAFIEACRRPLPTVIWCNSLRSNPETLSKKITQKGFVPVPLSWSQGAFKLHNAYGVGNSLEYLIGLYHVQEEVALLPVMLLEPKPGEIVLDLCAAPGNKSAQIAVQKQNMGTVVANEVNAGRMQPLRASINRLGLTNVTATHCDASCFPKQSVQFDKVIADVFCSCEGTWRKKSDILKHGGKRYSQKIANSQIVILVKAIQLCRPGGRVVYSTCTYAPEENEMVVQAALDAVAQKIQAEIKACLLPGLKGSPGLSKWNGKQFRPDMGNAVRIYPHQNDTGGFFVAVIDKLTDDRGNKISAAPNSFDPTRVEFLDKKKYLNFLENRFGIPLSVFDNYLFLHTNKKFAAILNEDHLQIASPSPYMVGLPLVHINMKYPKLTTAGAMVFGKYAEKNVLQLTEEQACQYLHGQVFNVELAQISNFENQGTIILKHENVSLGVGTVCCKNGRAELTGQFPKAWQRNAF